MHEYRARRWTALLIAGLTCTLLTAAPGFAHQAERGGEGASPAATTQAQPDDGAPTEPAADVEATPSDVATPAPAATTPDPMAAAEDAAAGQVIPLEDAEGARAYTAAGPTITVSKTSGLNPNGDVVTVTGSGFDETKGIYVAFCVKPDPGEAPGPCLGGVDMGGDSERSIWVSSNPPPYGADLAKPYGPGGSFTVQLKITGRDEFTDCLTQTCGVSTRADHTRSSDRSQDVFVPVTFAGQEGDPDPSPSPSASPGATPSPTATTASGGGSSSSGAKGSSGASGSGGGSGSQGSGKQLPRTGVDSWALLALGTGLLGAGALTLRRARQL